MAADRRTALKKRAEKIVKAVKAAKSKAARAKAAKPKAAKPKATKKKVTAPKGGRTTSAATRAVVTKQTSTQRKAAARPKRTRQTVVPSPFGRGGRREITFALNGSPRTFAVTADELLYDVLRDAGCKGVKAGCHEGACGACTVLVDGRPMMSCILRAWQVEGRSVETIEGVGSYDAPHPIQRALVDNGAVQCGFCIPGMVLSAKALLDRRPDPSEDELKTAMDGNLCRCTGYEKIWDALQQVIAERGAKR